LNELSEREQSILKLCKGGKSADEVAAHFGISREEVMAAFERLKRLAEAEKRAEFGPEYIAANQHHWVGKVAAFFADGFRGRRGFVRIHALQINEEDWRAEISHESSTRSLTGKRFWIGPFRYEELALVAPDRWHFPYLSERFYFDPKWFDALRKSPPNRRRSRRKQLPPGAAGELPKPPSPRRK